jgi:cytochrome c-type biogenesis protein
MDLTSISLSLALVFAFLAGLASFLSPCVFTLVPAYIGYLGGRTAAYASKEKPNRWLTFSHGLAFVLGFSVIFVALGFTTSAIGRLLYDISPWLTRIGGVIIIIFGIHMTGLVRIPFLEYDLRPQSLPERKWGYLSSALMGVFFSAGWSPCIGPILSSIFTFTAAKGNILEGTLLLAAYSLGLGVPFLLATTQISLVTTVIRKYGKVMHYIEVGMGVLLIILGVMMILGQFTQFAIWASRFLTSIDEVAVGKVILVAIFSLAFLGMVPAYIASRKGRNFYDWWFFGASLLPVALVMALMIKPAPLETAGEPPAEISEPKAG